MKDFHPRGRGGLTRDPEGPGTFSPTGAWGDPTLATAQKGQRALEMVLEGILRDIAELRAAPAPPRRVRDGSGGAWGRGPSFTGEGKKG